MERNIKGQKKLKRGTEPLPTNIKEIGFDYLSTAMATNDVVGLYRKVKGLLNDLSKQIPYVQLALLDETGKFIFLETSYDSHWSKDLINAIDLYRLSILGTRLDQDSFFREASENKNYQGKLLVCNRIENLEEKTFYDVYSMDKDNPIEEKPIMPNKEIKILINDVLEIASVENNRNDLDKYLRKMIIVGKKLKPIGNTPAMTGLIGFLLEDSGEEPTSIEDYKNILYERKDQVISIASMIETTGSIFQSLALSQASSMEPQRLCDEVLINDWVDFLGNRILCLNGNDEDSKFFKLIVEKFLQIDDEFIKVSILRKIINNSEIKLISKTKFIDHLIEFAKEKIDEESYIEVCSLLAGISNSKYNAFNLSSTVIKSIIIDCINVIEKEFNRIDFGLDQNELILTKRKILRILSIIVDWFSNNECNDEIQSVVIINLFDLFEPKLVFFSSKSELELIVSSFILFLINMESNNKDFAYEIISKIILESEMQLKDQQLTDYIGPFSCLNMIDGNVIISKFANSDIKDQLKNIFEIKNRRINKNKKDKNKIYSVISGKGGVGKSITALGLAIHLAHEKRNKVCLVDIDFFGPTFNKFVKSHGENQGEIYLNEYIWAEYLIEIETSNIYTEEQKSKYLSNIKEILDERGTYIFKNIERKKDHLLEFRENPERISGLLASTCWDNLKVCLSSTKHIDQDIMLPLVQGNLNVLFRQLKNLCNALGKKGFDHIIFDCPAELKQISTRITELNDSFNFENIFVTTLYEPAIEPILQEVKCGEFINTKNSLIINKIRPLDKKYLETRCEIINYLRQCKTNESRSLIYSREYYDQCFHFNKVDFFLWNEYLENFSINRKDALQEFEFNKIEETMKDVWNNLVS